MALLQVYISSRCWTCEEAKRIVADVVPQFSEVVAEILDIDDVVPPLSVFAVPTYLLDGLVIFLGNPTRQELGQKLDQTQAASRR